jgi:AcrR family transcriptional regulator
VIGSRPHTRGRILQAAYSQFRKRGYARSNMDEIAAQAKLTKRSLYTYFTSKDALLEAVLEEQSALSEASARDVDLDANSATEYVQRLFSDLGLWALKPRWAGAGFSRLAIELADLPGHPARVIARRHKAVVEQHLADHLESAGVAAPHDRAREIQLLIEGAMVLLLIHGDRGYLDAAMAVAGRLVSDPALTDPAHPVGSAHECPP